MNFKKLVFTALAGVAICCTLSGKIHAEEFSHNKISHTNYNDEIVFNGRVYQEHAGTDWDENVINKNIEVYKSQNYYVGHQVVKIISTNKVLSDKWFYDGTSQSNLDKEIEKEYKSVSYSIIKANENSSFNSDGGSHSSASLVPNEGHLTGWRKIGRTWFFVLDGKITSTKTNTKYPADKIVYGYLMSGNKDEKSYYSTDKSPKNNSVMYGRWYQELRKFTALHNYLFASISSHKKNQILVDQYTGKVIYNKWHKYCQWKFQKNGHIYVKTFYIKSDKNGHVAKGTYKGLFGKWIFGANGVLKKYIAYK